MNYEFRTVYGQNDDITFIMRDSYHENRDPHASEVVGWYYGEPNEENTTYFIGKLVAYYD